MSCIPVCGLRMLSGFPGPELSGRQGLRESSQPVIGLGPGTELIMESLEKYPDFNETTVCTVSVCLSLSVFCLKHF